jgi:hypothetical protein
MHDSRLVCCLQRLHDLPGDADSFILRQRPARNSRGKSVSFDELEDEEVGIGDVQKIVNGANIGMVQCCQNLGFTQEARHALVIVRKIFGQQLDGDVSAQL